MIYDGRLYIIQRQKQGSISLIQEQKIQLRCEKGTSVGYLEVLVKTDKNNLTNLNVEDVYLINQDMGLDKIEITKTLGKIRKDYPNDVLGFRPSKKDDAMSSFYEKYFEEINSYGVSLISLKQFIGGYFFETFKSIVVKDIIAIPPHQIPEGVFNQGTRKRKKVGKHSLNFIMNNNNQDINREDGDNFNQDELTDSGDDIRSKSDELIKKIKFASFYNGNNHILSQNNDNGKQEISQNHHPSIQNTNSNHINNINTNSVPITNETFNVFRNSIFGQRLEEYYPLNELNMFESYENNILDIRNLRIYHNKNGPLLFHLENHYPRFDLISQDYIFLNIFASINVSYQFELTLKFEIPQRVVCLYNSRQTHSTIRCKTKIVINDILTNPPHHKLFKSLKLMVNGIVLMVPCLIEIK